MRQPASVSFKRDIKPVFAARFRAKVPDRIQDLKQRGMLDETVILWATECESDEFGYKLLDCANLTQVYDVHATILRLLGINYERLTFYHNGIQRRLTDVHSHGVKPLLT